MDIYEQLKKLIKPHIKNKDVNSDSSLRDLGVDSLELLSIVIEVEEKFNVEFSDDELLLLKTVDDFIIALKGKGVK
jgi:acyl carrier protein